MKLNYVFLVFSLKHTGILLAYGDIDSKLEYGLCVVFFLRDGTYFLFRDKRVT